MHIEVHSIQYDIVFWSAKKHFKGTEYTHIEYYDVLKEIYSAKLEILISCWMDG